MVRYIKDKSHELFFGWCRLGCVCVGNAGQNQQYERKEDDKKPFLPADVDLTKRGRWRIWGQLLFLKNNSRLADFNPGSWRPTQIPQL